jgi:ABC-type phosphate/phosphonate transport system permease subunit
MSLACDTPLDEGTQGTQSTAGVKEMLFDREHWNDISSVMHDIDESQGMEQDLAAAGTSPMKPCHKTIEVCSHESHLYLLFYTLQIIILSTVICFSLSIPFLSKHTTFSNAITSHVKLLLIFY